MWFAYKWLVGKKGGQFHFLAVAEQNTLNRHVIDVVAVHFMLPQKMEGIVWPSYFINSQMFNTS